MDSYNKELFEIAAKELGIEDSTFAKSLAFSICLLEEILASLPNKILSIVHNIFLHSENKQKMVQIFQKTVVGLMKVQDKSKEKEDRIAELENTAIKKYTDCIEWVHIFNMLTDEQKEEIRKLHKEVYGIEYPIKK